jgi:cell division transport system permease protein
MIALALYVVGLFSLATFNLQEALETLEERVEIVAYVLDGTTPDEMELARSELTALSEVLAVRTVSKARALEKARADLPEFQDVLGDLEWNPLPASLEIQLQPGSRTPRAIQRVAEATERYDFVEDVLYGREWVDKLFTLRHIGAITSIGLGAAFAAVAALIIGTAVRIAIYARREEIHVMRLVGARDGFIRQPFLLEGMLTGLVGGILATAIVFLTYLAIQSFLFDLEWLPRSWVALGIGAGGLFGLLASGFAIGRHLREV